MLSCGSKRGSGPGPGPYRPKLHVWADTIPGLLMASDPPSYITTYIGYGSLGRRLHFLLYFREGTDL